jgi:hypothetical protein
MISTLGHHLNKTLLVSIPSMFENGDPRACTLTGIEPSGLWLESREWSKLLPSGDKRAVTHIFVPFAQIAYLLEPAPERKTEVPAIQPSPGRRNIRKKKHRPA